MKKLIAVVFMAASLAACDVDVKYDATPTVDVYVIDMVTRSGDCEDLEQIYIEVSGGKVVLSLHEYIEVTGTMRGDRFDGNGFMLYTGYEVRMNGSVGPDGALSGTWYSRAQGCKGVFFEK